MIMDLESYVALRRDGAGGDGATGEGRTVTALNCIADAALLLDELEGSAADLENPHLMESFQVARNGLHMAWLALANTCDLLPREASDHPEVGSSPFIPAPLPCGKGEPSTQLRE